MAKDALTLALRGMRKIGRREEPQGSSAPSVAIVLGDEGARQPNSERTERATTMPNELADPMACAHCGDTEHATEDHESLMMDE